MLKNYYTMKRRILYNILNEWRDEDIDDTPIDVDDDMDLEPISSDMSDEPDLEDDDFVLTTGNKKLYPIYSEEIPGLVDNQRYNDYVIFAPHTFDIYSFDISKPYDIDQCVENIKKIQSIIISTVIGDYDVNNFNKYNIVKDILTNILNEFDPYRKYFDVEVDERGDSTIILSDNFYNKFVPNDDYYICPPDCKHFLKNENIQLKYVEKINKGMIEYNNYDLFSVSPKKYVFQGLPSQMFIKDNEIVPLLTRFCDFDNQTHKIDTFTVIFNTGDSSIFFDSYMKPHYQNFCAKSYNNLISMSFEVSKKDGSFILTAQYPFIKNGISTYEECAVSGEILPFLVKG